MTTREKNYLPARPSRRNTIRVRASPERSASLDAIASQPVADRHLAPLNLGRDLRDRQAGLGESLQALPLEATSRRMPVMPHSFQPVLFDPIADCRLVAI